MDLIRRILVLKSTLFEMLAMMRVMNHQSMLHNIFLVVLRHSVLLSLVLEVLVPFAYDQQYPNTLLNHPIKQYSCINLDGDCSHIAKLSYVMLREYLRFVSEDEKRDELL